MRHWKRGNPRIYLEMFKQADTDLSLWLLLVVSCDQFITAQQSHHFLGKLTPGMT